MEETAQLVPPSLVSLGRGHLMLRSMLVLPFLFLVACVNHQRFYQASAPKLRNDYAKESTRGIVTAAHPLAASAGLTMLQLGGNAVDAAVASSFAISVLRPQSTGLGGGGFLLFYDAQRKAVEVFDFRERAPLRAQRHMYVHKEGAWREFFYEGKRVGLSSEEGHLAVGVPGLVAGLLEVHNRLGSLPLPKVMAPAIRIAEEGFPVYKSLAESIREKKEVLAHFPGSRKLFLPNGNPLAEGDLLVQKDLARTLVAISKHGSEAFYRGMTARKIVEEMKRGGGLITAQDLSSYKVVQHEPIQGSYRGYSIFSMPPPSSGGVHIVQIFNMLSFFDVGSLAFHSAEHIHLLTETMKRAFADRAQYLGDPKFAKVPVKGLTSLEYARELRTSLSLEKATPSSELAAGNPLPYEPPSTTHLSVVDPWGNAVSTTQTINATFGSCVVAEGTGIVLNNEMDDFSKQPGAPNLFGLVGGEANSIAPGKTMLSSMSPSIVLDPSGELFLILGAQGGPRIISSVLQTISNVIDFKMPLPDAVHAKRIHHQWLPDHIRTETDGLPKDVMRTLEAKGHTIKESSAPTGDVQAIGRIHGGWIGVSDTRSEGQPIGL
ncbi:MAG: gamma-glutamyltransferase [Deltaproteobacteria bacterium]|nr:gamma-glutamyltransferase [Deltaproteobacteria bacterium]